MEMMGIVEQIAARKKALRIPELADMLGMSKRGLYAMVKDGRLPAIKIGDTVVLDPKTTAAWVQKRITSSGCL